MTEHPRPRLVVSRCLELEACRYNGVAIRAPLVRRLETFVELLPVCPEVEIGLGVPRDPVRLVRAGGRPRMVQPSSGQDLTERMEAFADRFLSRVGPVDGFLLKSRSPSCGLGDTKLFAAAGDSEPVDRGAGLFARAVLDRFGDRAIEDEARLEQDHQVRRHFLTRLFALARLREAAARPAGLQAFHAAHKLLLMAHDRPTLGALGRLLARPEERPPTELRAAYAAGFARALARPARPGAHVDVLLHAMGYFKSDLPRDEKARFLHALEAYRAGRLPLDAPRNTVRGWIESYGQEYLAGQAYFEPFPRALTGSSAPAGGGRAP